MRATGPTPATLRLLACVEAFSHQEEGAVGHDDWSALASILERELALLQNLPEDPARHTDAALAARAQLLRQRYAAMSERIAAARARDETEYSALRETSRRVHGVRHAYIRSAA
ncbi:MAG: hypothetical protein NTU80_10455 [Verrucomicrobia bacterium]|nr:hypothetical protein [Verrucomicrobiota bacterium]